MKKLILIGTLMMVVLVGVVMSGCGELDDDMKIPDPGGDFEYTKVMVTLTEKASARDKVWSPSDFPEFAFSEIENVGLIGNQKYLIFYLAEPSRDNVLRAINKLRKRPEIYSAKVDGINRLDLD